jgi:hypothetical protein
MEELIAQYGQYALMIKNNTMLNDTVKSDILLKMAQALAALVPLASSGQDQQMQAAKQQQDLMMNQAKHEQNLQMQADKHNLNMQQAAQKAAMNLDMMQQKAQNQQQMMTNQPNPSK